MAVDTRGFTTPEQSFEGLYRAAEGVQKRQYREDQLNLQREGKRNAASTFLTNYLDKKDFLTGTNYDPIIVSQLNDTMQEGAMLASKGADSSTIMMALAPRVNRLSEYSTKAKLVNQRLKDQLATIPQNAGYDKNRLEQEAKRYAFYDEKNELKDISTLDPNMDYLTETIKLYPERVTTDFGIDEFVKNSPRFTNTKDISRYNKLGGMSRSKVKITSPNWLIPDEDERGAVTGLVPKYETALEDGEPLMYDFKDETGKTTKAPVRLLEEREFNSIMASNPGIADWVRGQVKSANPDIDMSSPQAKNSARAILYSELKRRSPGSIEDMEVQNKPSPQQVRINLGYAPYGSTGKTAAPIDLSEYPDEDGWKNITSLTQGIKVTGLPDGKTLLAETVKYNPVTKRVKYKEYTTKDDAGKYGAGTEKDVSLTKFLQDVKSNNPGTDMKFLEGLENATGVSAQPKSKPPLDSFDMGNTTKPDSTKRKPLSSFKK